jgi:L-lactate dehydrogenase
LDNESAVLNVSTLLNNYHGVSDVYLGVPCIVDETGIREVLPLTINEKEKEMLQSSARKLKEIIQSIAM